MRIPLLGGHQHSLTTVSALIPSTHDHRPRLCSENGVFVKLKLVLPVGLLAAFSLIQAVAQTVTITVNGQQVCADTTKACTVNISVTPASGGGSTTPPTSGTAAAPGFSPAVGSYTGAQNVVLSTSTSGATIYYTTDGTTPTTSSKAYSGAIAITATTTIKAFATATGYTASSVVSGSYTISTAPTGKAITACQPITASGSYYLANDVTCGTQSMALNANNISLNLNGHTIYYGNSSTVAPAITMCDNWFTGLPQVACGNGAHAAPTVFNGKIVQVKGSAPFTHAIWIGQGNGISPGSFHDLNITIQEPGTQAIYGDYPGIGWKIQNNVINDNVTNIQHPGQSPLSARSQFQGTAIYMYNGDNSTSSSYDIISGNTINGTPQGGIYDSSQKAQIYSNTIHMTSLYSNDYGVTVLADGQLVHDNIIDGRGRGIDAENSRFQLYANTINVHEEANNSEYGGCELGGTDGIRVKNYSGNTPTTGASISNNNITVNGQYCEANAIALTGLEGGSLAISGNTFNVIPGSSTSADAAGNGYYVVRYDEVRAESAVSWSKNIFKGHGVFIYWDGADSVIQSGQTWQLSGPTVFAIDGGASTNGYPQALTIADAVTSPSVMCGSNSSALVRVGSMTKQCN